MQDSIVQVGDPVLRKHAQPVSKKDIGTPALTKLIARMQKVLAKEPHGVALAAPQVGESLQLFIIAGSVFSAPEETLPEGASPEPTPPDLVFINPEIVRLSRAKQELSEGCLSVRGKYGTVLRHAKATVKALDEHGKPFTYHGTGLVAQIFQHECDHLGGTLYIDKAATLEDDQEGHSFGHKNKEAATH